MSSSPSGRWQALTYAATIFVSAFLLFQVQPLVSKHILPWFGGSPTVWTTCMLFFQTLLLAGYTYAHFTQRLKPAAQVFLQAAVMAVALAQLVVLGVLPDGHWQPQEGGDPVQQILSMLLVSVGLPFFVLSSTAPLIQSWFARSFPGRVPYRLYALSNFGSLLALLSYPFVFEPTIDLPMQAGLWSAGFVAYAVLCGLAGVGLLRGEKQRAAGLEAAPDEAAEKAGQDPIQPPTWLQFTLWLLLPAFATIALLATTNYVCTNVAVVPFLWVVPLALYLITFIIAFDHTRWYRRAPLAFFTLASIYVAALLFYDGDGRVKLFDCATTGRLARLCAENVTGGSADFGPDSPPTLESPMFHIGYYGALFWNFAAMFGVCMLCHGEVVRQRPHPRYLTSFYLMIAAGGVLGGVLVSLVAPRVFNTYFEWPLFMFFGFIWAVAIVLQKLVHAAFPGDAVALAARRFSALPLIVLVVLLLPASLVMLDLVEYLHVSDKGVHMRERNFFGALTIREKNDADHPERDSMFLYHGIIAHGSQFTSSERRGQPTTYYSTVSGVGRTLNFFRRQPEVGSLRVGVVGLGTGTVASYISGGDSIAFYEINPAVVELAEGGRWFSYLQDARARGGKCEIKLGDARIKLEQELQPPGPRRFHVLALDAFSGDAIPIHLLTAEAFDTYVRHLSTSVDDGVDGALALHISNRYLDLEPVVRAMAAKFGFGMATIHSPGDTDRVLYEAQWVVLTRNETLLKTLAPFAADAQESMKPPLLWTDDRNNLFDVLKQTSP